MTMDDRDMADERGVAAPAGRAEGATRPDDGEMDRFLEQVEVAVRERAEEADTGVVEDEAYARALEEASEEAAVEEPLEAAEHEAEEGPNSDEPVDEVADGIAPGRGPRYRPRASAARVAEMRVARQVEPHREAPSGVAEATLERVGSTAVAPGTGPSMGAENEAVARELVKRVSSALVAGLKEQTRGLRDEIAGVKELVPNVVGEDVKALARHVESLAEQLRIQRADETRKTELSGRRWKWPLRGLAAAVGVALVLAGAVTQARWSVLDDGTNGWKDIVWNRHGIAIAECIKRADGRGRGEVCAVRAQIR